MMTSKDLTTLNFLEFSSQGRRYVRAYKNEWISKKVTGKVKGVSRAKEQHHVGALVDQYRSSVPEISGKIPGICWETMVLRKQPFEGRRSFQKRSP